MNNARLVVRTDPHPDHRINAIRHLATIDDHGSLLTVLFVEVALDDPNPNVRAAALDAITSRPPGRATTGSWRALFTRAFRELDTVAHLVIVAANTPTVRWAAANDPRPEVRAAANHTLTGRSDRPVIVPNRIGHP